MILKSSHLKTTSLNIDAKYTGIVCDVNENIAFVPELATPGDGRQCTLIQKWDLSYLTSGNPEAIVAYSGVMESEIRPQDKLHDRSLLIRHFKSSFLNVQMYLNEHVPANYRTTRTMKNSFDNFADSTIHCLEQAGFYR
ncbi:hypothetical protein GZH53_09635 [Flavihumibacter sp. R14]|nr:hypothetical protein [Flavihumibacter soli]